MEKKFVTFYSGELWLGIDIDEVREINRIDDITPVPSSDLDVLGVINLRGCLVTILDLHRILTGEDRPLRSGRINVIIDSGGDEIGLLSDRLGDVETCSEQDIDPVPAHVSDTHGRFFSGVVQREGGILSVLKVEAVLKLEAC